MIWHRRCAATTNRREFLKSAGHFAVAAGLGFVWPRSTRTNQPVSLREKASSKGLLYGSATTRKHLTEDRDFADLVAEQCGLLVPEGELKWNALRPSPTAFDFRAGDWMLNWAHSHSLQLRGTALVWHHALPNWFEGYASRSNATHLMVEHIHTVMRHYAGKLHSWDVVNEAIMPRGLRDTPWLRLIGPDYIATAFREAAQADPTTKLTYNDYDLSYASDEPKRTQVLQLLRQLVSKNVPIHALGIQGHLRSNGTAFDPKKMTKFLNQVADLGLAIMITELDVEDNDPESSVAQRDSSIANMYREYLSTVLQHQAVKAVITWGLSDRYTWLAGKRPRSDGQGVRPLVFDQDLLPKPAFSALANAFDQAPVRSQ